jgi:hypothetical protein
MKMVKIIITKSIIKIGDRHKNSISLIISSLDIERSSNLVELNKFINFIISEIKSKCGKMKISEDVLLHKYHKELITEIANIFR